MLNLLDLLQGIIYAPFVFSNEKNETYLYGIETVFSVLSLHQTMQAARCPTDELSLTNCAVVSEKDLQSGQ